MRFSQQQQQQQQRAARVACACTARQTAKMSAGARAPARAAAPIALRACSKFRHRHKAAAAPTGPAPASESANKNCNKNRARVRTYTGRTLGALCSLALLVVALQALLQVGSLKSESQGHLDRQHRHHRRDYRQQATVAHWSSGLKSPTLSGGGGGVVSGQRQSEAAHQNKRAARQAPQQQQQQQSQSARARASARKSPAGVSRARSWRPDVFLAQTNNLSSQRWAAPASFVGAIARAPGPGRSARQAQAAGGAKSPCALILQRTYVRKLSDDIESNEADVEPTGRAERVCITYEHVNQALEAAKRARNFQLTPELQEALQSIEPTPPFISKLGELNLEVVKLLRDQFDLSPDEIVNGLPLIDTTRTNLWALCPLMVKPIKCDPTGRFRSFTGHCNNLQNPTWGAAQTAYTRYLPPKHPDGIEEFRVSVVDGSQLPPVRLVSSTVHRDADQPSGDLSLLIMVFGQLVDHELTQAAPPRDEAGLDFNCCKEPGKSEYCSPIAIPQDDPLYSRYAQGCMDFKRSLVGLRPNCRLGPRVHINTITATIDGNTLYGSTKAVADQLRAFSGGLLKVQNVFKSLKPLLPKQLIRPDLDCFERPANMFCFLAGDDRVNEQPTLTVMHTILVREHNRLASQLAKLNAHWDDERTFHETRHLMAAKLQHLVFNEYLPMLIGKELMAAHNLTLGRAGLGDAMAHSNLYRADLNPAISQGFTTAAFRQGHTFIQGQVRLHDSRAHAYLGSIPLRRLFKRPFHYYSPGRFDTVLAGIMSTPAQTYDPFITQEIAGHLFQEPGEDFGMDLISINLQRGREQGTPGYAEYREKLCGLPRVRTFEDLLPIMSNRTAYHYSRLYKSPMDIDLWSGGVSELPGEGALVGPTFACIIAKQMAHIRHADRFWFENANQPSSFTAAQLREIKKGSLAKLLCVNSDGMQFIQRKALKLPHAVFNPRVPCKDLDDIDLKHWRENPNSLGTFLS